jgi:hypothetical protein
MSESFFHHAGERDIVFHDDERLGFVRRDDNGTLYFVDTTMAESGTPDPETGPSAIRRRLESNRRDRTHSVCRREPEIRVALAEVIAGRPRRV